MNSSLEVLKIAIKSQDSEILRNYLQVCKESRLFQTDSCNHESVISFIHSLLSVGNDYIKGIEILQVFLPQCKFDIVGQHLLRWLQECSRGLQSRSYSISVYSLLRELIFFSKEYPDIKKQTSLTFIPKILENFTKKSNNNGASQNPIPLLSCLEVILTNYGKACTSWKNRIEELLFSYLESPPEVVHSSARCFILLTSIAPPTSDNEEYKQLWYNKQELLISALHTNLDNLFNNVTVVKGAYDKYVTKYDKNFIPEITERFPLKKVQKLTAQFVGIAEFLRILLLGNYPVSKRVHPDGILSVICRVLAITCDTLKAKISNDTIILSTQIPALHKACLSVLEALIQCGRRSLFPHSNLICKLLTQTLKWTLVQSCEYGQNKPYSSLRIQAYNCFSTWLTISRIGSNVKYYLDDILPSVYSDIHSDKPTITLSVSSKRLKGKAGKKERKKNQELSNLENKTAAILDPEANKDVCEAALNFLPPLLESTSAFISPIIHKQLQESIVNELMMIQAAGKVSLDLPIPYQSEPCRLALYKALLALCNNHHPEFPAPCNYAMPIFAMGLNDNCLPISRFCGQAAANIEKMIHPIGPTLSFPLTLSSDISFTNIQDPKDRYLRSQHKQSISPNKNIDKEVNNTFSGNESIILESLPNLFEKEQNSISQNVKNNSHSSSSSSNKETLPEDLNGSNINDKTNYGNERLTEVAPVETLEVSNGIVDLVADEITEQIVNDEIPIRLKSQKRLIGSDNDISEADFESYPQQKKVKDDLTIITSGQESISPKNPEANEIEANMLSSFVDLIT